MITFPLKHQNFSSSIDLEVCDVYLEHEMTSLLAELYAWSFNAGLALPCPLY
jgi:hypothetical protein